MFLVLGNKVISVAKGGLETIRVQSGLTPGFLEYIPPSVKGEKDPAVAFSEEGSCLN